MFFNILIVLNLYSFVYKKKIGNDIFRKISFYIVSFVVMTISIGALGKIGEKLFYAIIFTILPLVPAVYGLYKHAFKDAALKTKEKSSSKKSTIWKIYFYFLLASLILSLLSLVKNLEKELVSWNTINLFISSFSLYGLYLYVFDKQKFSKQLWKVFLAMLIIWDVTYYFALSPSTNSEMLEKIPKAPYYAMFMITIPLYYALYLYSFKSERKKVKNIT
ncbi:hypothetical protein C0583_05580 [Candidatus Parcubacteria bacterium]|nr:MAG: hypothetical protein C0583_05580 [Candidatus Parcubacteria bacterium]